MSIDNSVADFLSGGGGKSAKFETIGDSIRGTVVSAEVRQQTDLDGTPKVWDDGKPMMQLVISLQTEARDDSDDDGIRNVYVKGSKKNPMSGASALVLALKAAGASLEVGGTLGVQYVGDGVQTKRGLTAPKEWKMAYKAPALDTGGLLDDAPVASPAAAPVAPASDPLAF